MKKRILSILLAAAMTVSLLTLPAGAASSDTRQFSDVTDLSLSQAVETLRLMGVLDGFGDGTFRPGAALTRAQFCKMVTYILNAEDQLGLYRTVTVFPDVKPSYWAASYINLAAKGKGIISGYADGSFHPDRTVTLGQAVTILLRLLGYKDENIGGVWPDSYMAQGALAGLTDGVGTDGSAALTRGQAAQLFLNLLRADTTEGGSYLSTLGTEEKGVVLVTSSATAADGQSNGLQLDASSTQIYQLASGKTSSGVLNGCRGTLLLNKQGKVLTFVPDESGDSKMITLASASATKVTDTAGAAYTIGSGAKAYYNGSQKDWSEVYSWLSAGTSVTLYLNTAGVVEYVMVGGGATATTALIVSEKGSTAGFASLAGSTSYTIVKDGAAATASDMRQYDVATYSAATNTIRVCDNRLTGYYEKCSPNPSEPTQITVLGYDFTVLPSAMDSVAKFKPGDQITLLLTEDNQVAGAVEAKGSITRANVKGIVKSVSESNAEVELLCGITVKGTVSLSQSDVERLDGQLVQVSSTQKGLLSLSRLTGGVSGALDVENKTLGSRKLADNVIIFENGADGMEVISLSQLTSATIPSNQISYAATDWADRVKLVVIGSAVGSTFVYGRAIFEDGDTTTIDEDTGEEVTTYGNNKLTLVAGKDKTYGPFETGYTAYNGECLGLSFTGSGSNKHIAALVRLTALKNVSNSAWSGEGAVTVGGRTYTVPSGVLCYNRQTQEWVSLTEAHAYATTSTLYVHNGAVRIIEVG